MRNLVHEPDVLDVGSAPAVSRAGLDERSPGLARTDTGRDQLFPTQHRRLENDFDGNGASGSHDGGNVGVDTGVVARSEKADVLYLQ